MTSLRFAPFSSLVCKPIFRRVLATSALGMISSAMGPMAHANDFVKPTAEELSMTSLPGYPGAPAVILYREELTRDDMHAVQHHERIKVLTEEGKKYANVALGYVSSRGGFYSSGDDKVLDAISGRTIHPDGTVVPFTGKPYLKVIEQTQGFKVQQKVFTLPAVEVGSILEYEYYTRINDNIFEAPIWMVQDDLYVREAHFAWWPTTHTLVDEDEKPINTITWFPVLPEGAKIERREEARTGPSTESATGQVYELRVKNVPPRVQEEYMPPIGSFSYRVNFSFSPYRTQQEYWQAIGKQWSKRVNNFAGPNNALREETAKVIAGASTPEEKLQKIYAAVMQLENTRYTREHDQREDKAAGLGEIKNAADVLSHKRGSPTQITELFIGMVRAAGLHAYAMWVPDRSEDVFVPSWLDTRQLDDTIAVVTVDGKDGFFDPGSRYCAFGQLAWQHTIVTGLRQGDNGTSLTSTPIEPFKINRLSRVANLKMSEEGEVTGKVDLTFNGSPALRWRQAALKGDDESLRKGLREYAEEILPKSLEIEVSEIKDATEYGKPLVVSYKVKGTVGTAMGKRTMLPADVFLSNTTATFPHEKRETAVYFHYPWLTQDAVRITLPPQYAIEAVPTTVRYEMSGHGAYALQVTAEPKSFTTRRDFVFGDVLVPSKDYTGLRTFYAQLESKDQESVVLKAAPKAAAAPSAAITEASK